jgi:hypothetical protein
MASHPGPGNHDAIGISYIIGALISDIIGLLESLFRVTRNSVAPDGIPT